MSKDRITPTGLAHVCTAAPHDGEDRRLVSSEADGAMTKHQCGIGIKMSRCRCCGIAQGRALAVQGRKRLELWSPVEATSSRSGEVTAAGPVDAVFKNGVLEIAFPNVSRKPGTAAKAPNDVPVTRQAKERALT